MAMAWTVASGLPLLGIVSLTLSFLLGGSFDPREGFVAIGFLALVGLGVGLVGILMATRSISEPIGALRSDLGRIRTGEFGTRTAVEDSSEVGLLQAGFNDMSAGLAERERIRETFGTYVDPEVAEHLLSAGTSLAGEEVEVTVMFIDIRNFTAYAETVQAETVVTEINRLWERFVPIIHRNSGHVDKYIGDGLMAVFGAPGRLLKHADCAHPLPLKAERSAPEPSPHRLELSPCPGRANALERIVDRDRVAVDACQDDGVLTEVAGHVLALGREPGLVRAVC